jgi:hypothetical protein
MQARDTLADLPFADAHAQYQAVAAMPHLEVVVRLDWQLALPPTAALAGAQRMHEVHHAVWAKPALAV